MTNGVCIRFNPRARTGATSTMRRRLSSYIVSIHAPARGATPSPCLRRPPRCRFNPRARTGRDPSRFRFLASFKVSIHAPARGATASSCATWRVLRRFNPRARTGRDPPAPRRPAGHFSFQSTRPHGARPIPLRCPPFVQKFQSTRPHGARPFINDLRAMHLSPVPTTRWGPDE